MKRIGLKPAYFPMVANGQKRSTIRAGAKTDLVGPAMLVAGSQSIAIAVSEVVVKPYAALTEDDARLDGFANLAELIAALESFYPDLGPADPVSILHFEPTEITR
ncbi:ASCH domain-containing protein [Novosphingobium sp. M1R2S20]|uniref:ASCH domain-containing protein n=1 Tax=Novosphingobium rhizovicinum TaxID=3228928 RepID=A0ABV3RAQ7_9SPHN